MKLTKIVSAVALLFAFSASASAIILVSEEFETDGNGTRYLASEFTNGADFFHRHDYGGANPHPNHVDQTLNSVGGGVHAEWAWAMEDITHATNPIGSGSSTDTAVLRLNDIDVTAYTDLQVSIEIAAIYNTTIFNDLVDTTDGLDIEYAFDANSGGTAGAANPTLLSGTYTTVGSFRGQGLIVNAGDAPNQTLPGTGVLLSNTLQDFTFSIPKLGNMLSIQIVGLSLDGSEEFVFDNIRVTGVPEPSPFLFLGLIGLMLGAKRYRPRFK